MKFMKRMLLFVTVMGFSVVNALPVDPPISFSTTPATALLNLKTRPLSPNHVPQSACKDMLPVHCSREGLCHTENEGPSPFKLTTSSKKVSPGGTIQVIIEGAENEKFKGIYLQGRIGEDPVGQFEDPDGNPLVVVSSCPGGEKNAVSYITRDNNKALNKWVINWIAPNAPGKEVIFKATIVKTFAEFWADVKSQFVKIEG